MARAEINRLMDNLRVQLPGSLDGAIRLELFNVLDEFLTESGLWVFDSEFTSDVATLEYPVGTGVASRVVRLLFVSDPEFTRSFPATMRIPGTIELASATTEDTEMVARVCLSILDPMDREGFPAIDDWIMKRYAMCIMHGVLGRMMGQIAKPFSNERMSVYHLRKYRNLMAQARAEGRRFNLFAGQTWSFPQNFA
jgi:hypothetical protein